MYLNEAIELTNLKPEFAEKNLFDLIAQAERNNFFGLCIPPYWVKKAAREIEKKPITLVTVIGFPFGYSRTETKIREIELAIDDGAREVDMVWNHSAYISGSNWAKVEVARAAKLCHEREVFLKVIVETSIHSEEALRAIVGECVEAGADFIKTSTGVVGKGASLEMVKKIKSWLPPTVGVKASGGIASKEEAVKLVEAGAERIGSSLAYSWF